jgi:hypothetical protein
MTTANQPASEPELTIEEQVDELYKMLIYSAGHDRTVVRPITPIGEKVDPETGRRFVEHGPGPVTVVTFYIAHLPGT